MKALKKNMKVNSLLGSIKRKHKDSTPERSTDLQLDTPEANAARSVRQFCESAGPNGQGDEVLYLPTIVEAAESSPGAAQECAYTIRKLLSKDNCTKPYIQYNAIMLIRILADNPGQSFTRNFDEKFVTTVKELLRVGRDPSVKQILMETLETFGREYSADRNLKPLNDMWTKEQEKMSKLLGPQPLQPRAMHAPPAQSNGQTYFSRNHNNNKLPAPQELATRIEEARNSAQLLIQVVQSTPPSEVVGNELVREFADRCLSASRSIQAYMIAENPAPENETMETLIETNEQLVKAMSQHQRAVLSARKAAGTSSAPADAGPPRTDSGFAAPPPGPPPGHQSKSAFSPQDQITRQIPPPGDHPPPASNEDDDPSSDKAASTRNPPYPSDNTSPAMDTFNNNTGAEPWHPGFKETQSYANRHSSSVNNTTKHAAVYDDEFSPIEPESPTTQQAQPPRYRY